MTFHDLLHHVSHALAEARAGASARGLDAPVTATAGHRVATAGTLHQYTFTVPADAPLMEDLPVTVVFPGDSDPAEGFVVGRHENVVVLQTFDAFGQTVESVTIVPDATGFFDTVSQRLAAMALQSDASTLGPAERLLPWLDPDQSGTAQISQSAGSTAVLTTIWTDNVVNRRAKLAATTLDLVRNNKRILLISPDHRRSDQILGAIARAVRGAGLPFKSLLSRYEMPVQEEAAGMPLQELGFAAQTHQLSVRSQADKATLRRKYERLRELTPLLAYKTQKQHDLDEVTLLEERLLSQLSGLRGKIKDINATVAEYESLPIWKRLAMQTVGKNVASLAEYRTIYEQTIQTLLKELETAKHRIEELSQEAALPKEVRREHHELKEEIKQLGGTKQIRELLAAQDDTNRQAFMETKRVVATTAARVVTDPLFNRVRFDVLIADEAPFIPAPFLLGAAGLIRERIVLSGDPRDIATARVWELAGASSLRRQ